MTHPQFAAKLRAASDRTGEKIWPLPLEAAYREQITSKVADLKKGRKWWDLW